MPLSALCAEKPPAVDAKDWKTRIEQQLERKVSFEWTDTPLCDAMKLLENLANISFVIHPKVNTSILISLRVNDMSIKKSLDWICAMNDLKTTLIYDAIFISPSQYKMPAWMEEADTRKDNNEPWRAELLDQLSKRVSFEVVDTPFSDAIKSLTNITGVNIIIDPLVMKNGDRAMSLRVRDMQASNALKWICLLADCKWELKDQAVFISNSADAKTVAKTDIKKEATINEPKINIEPFDPSQSGMLIYKLPQDLPNVTLEDLKMLLAKIAPNIKLEVVEKFQLLLIRSDDQKELQRAVMLINKLRDCQSPPASAPALEQKSAPIAPEKKETQKQGDKKVLHFKSEMRIHDKTETIK